MWECFLFFSFLFFCVKETLHEKSLTWELFTKQKLFRREKGHLKNSSMLLNLTMYTVFPRRWSRRKAEKVSLNRIRIYANKQARMNFFFRLQPSKDIQVEMVSWFRPWIHHPASQHVGSTSQHLIQAFYQSFKHAGLVCFTMNINVFGNVATARVLLVAQGASSLRKRCRSVVL